MKKTNVHIIMLFLSLPFLIFLSCAKQKEIQENKKDSFKELTKLLDSAITRETKNGIITISYCPDNTCETFSMPRGNPIEKLSDFVYLYLYFVSDYSYLDTLRKRVAAEDVDTIILRNKQSTMANNQLEDAKKIIESLARDYSIKATFVRYDESARNEVNIDIRSELSRVKK